MILRVTAADENHWEQEGTTSVVRSAPKEREELSQGWAPFANPWNPCLHDQRAPGGARGAPATPAGVHIVIPLRSGGSLRSPPA